MTWEYTTRPSFCTWECALALACTQACTRYSVYTWLPGDERWIECDLEFDRSSFLLRVLVFRNVFIYYGWIQFDQSSLIRVALSSSLDKCRYGQHLNIVCRQTVRTC